MRMSTSITDLIDNASISYDAPDHKNHKLFPNGFKNYQGRVCIDETIFRYIVRVGKAKNGMIFYDINLEVDVRVPRAKRTSLIKSSTSNNSISNSPEKVKEKFSDRDSDEYSRIQEMQIQLNNTRDSIKEIESSDEFKLQMEKLSKGIGTDDVDKSIAEYKKWGEESGYTELVEKKKSLQDELDNLRKQYSENITNQAIQKEKEAIAKSGLSESDYFRKLAEKEFGYTPYFYDAGYIVPNGKMLNFSGEKGRHYGSRGQDHRAIGVVYANVEGSQARLKFMGEGNVRIMPESPGLDISSSVEPTTEQYSTIRKFVREYAKEEYFNIDLTDANGNVVGNYEYEGKVTPDRVINDIKYFFVNGTTREQSSISKFLYSDRDYSYDELVSKPDMTVTVLGQTPPQSRKDIIDKARKNVIEVGKKNNDGSTSVYIEDIKNDVIVTRDTIQHSLDRRIKVNGLVVLKIGEILKNSIKINNMLPREDNIEESYILLGAAKDSNNNYYVTFVVNSYSNTVASIDVVYSANAKKESAGINSPRLSTASTDSVISIAELLEKVNSYFPDILPEDVLRHFGRAERPEGVLGKSALYSDREESISTEELYDLVGENERLKKRVEILTADIERWKDRLKMEGKVTNGQYFRTSTLENIAGHIRKKYNSNIDKARLTDMLREITQTIHSLYSLGITSDQLLNEHLLPVAYAITEEIETKDIVNEEANSILKAIRDEKIVVGEHQISELKSIYDTRWNRAFFGKIGGLVMAIAGRVLMIPKGNYDANTEYEMLDIVTENGMAYIARRKVQGVAPSQDNGDNWQVLVDISDIISNAQNG